VTGDWRIPAEAIQPASIDLRLGEHAWALRCSFLPDSNSTVEEKVESLAFDRIDLRDGVTLERDRPYLVPLIEQLRLPAEVRARANPKSSTGRLDMFTRVLTDRSHRFDEIAPGYHGALYLEVVPRTFAIRVKTGLALNQVRLISGEALLSDDELLALHRELPLLYLDSHPLSESELSLAHGLFLRLAVSGGADRTVGYRAKKNSLPIDLTRPGTLRWQDYWEPVHPEGGGRIVLEPESSICMPRACASRHTRPESFARSAGSCPACAGFFRPRALATPGPPGHHSSHHRHSPGSRGHSGPAVRAPSTVVQARLPERMAAV
jgi:dCTP deaminase